MLKTADGTTLLIDPYLDTGDPPRTIQMIPVPFEPSVIEDTDDVLATHEHVHSSSQAPILAETGADFCGPDDVVAVARGRAVAQHQRCRDNQLVTLSEGETFSVSSFTVHGEQAYDPAATYPVTCVIKHEAKTFFHGGDSRPADAFDNISNDYDIARHPRVRNQGKDARPRHRCFRAYEVVQRGERTRHCRDCTRTR